jgi:fructokinase
MNPIVGIGEVLWDVYEKDNIRTAGGAPFNFAFHCQQLGHPAVIVSRVGDDALGEELLARVRELGMNTDYIDIDREHATGTVRIVHDEYKVPTFTITQNVAWDYLEWSDKLATLARHCRAVCFGSLAQRSATGWETVQRFIHTHFHYGECAPWRIFDINLRQNEFQVDAIRASLARADWVKLNEEEVPRLATLLNRDCADAGEFVKQLVPLSTPENRCAIWTHGEAGCDVFAYGEAIREPGVRAKFVDTVGAGDAFTAAMVCLRLEGRPLRECARFANCYAARVCEHEGGTPRIDRAEVERIAFGG